MLGLAPPQNIDGISMLPTLLGNDAQQQEHEYLYWEFHERGFGQAVRMGQWKAVRNEKDQPIELYNMEEDIGETTNIADQHPDIVARIAEIFKTARIDSPVFPVE